MPDGTDIQTDLAEEVSVLPAISAVAAEEWDACAGAENPFLSHDFLNALEESGSVRAQTGWLPRHLAVNDANGKLAAAMPLYMKGHSQGEYVFDWGWADAYERAGGRYYPKLLSAVPFTPATGPRMLVRPDIDRARAQEILAGGIEEEKQSREDAVVEVFPLQPDGEEHQEEEEPFEDPFVELGGMTGRKRPGQVDLDRFAGAGHLDEMLDAGGVEPIQGFGDEDRGLVVKGPGKDDPDSGFRDATVELAVDEVGDPHQEDSDRRDHHEVVPEPRPGELGDPGVDPSEKDQAQDAPMAGHAALEKLEEDPRALAELLPVVEEHVAEAAAQHNAAERGKSDEVGHLVLPELAAPVPDELLQQEIGEKEAQHVGETVPADPKGVREPDQEGTQVMDPGGGVGENGNEVGHGGYFPRPPRGFKLKPGPPPQQNILK